MSQFKPEHDHEVRNACESCGFVNYNNSKPTASALILNDKEEALLVRRAWYPYKGFLDIPGGFLEPGEHPEDGAKREVMEELGIEVELGELLIITMDEYVDGTEEAEINTSGYGVHTLNLCYLARITKGDPVATEELAGFEWVPLRDVKNRLEEVAFPGNREALKRLLKEKDL